MSLPFFSKKKKTPPIEQETAEQILSNVFMICERVPNTIPLPVLCSYSNYRKERYALQRTIIICILVVFVLLPALFVVPRITVILRVNARSGNPVYDVSVSTKLPIRQMYASIDGRTVPVYEAASHEYVVHPNQNGKMTIKVMLFNNQINTIDMNISSVDMDTPMLVSTEFGEDKIRFFLADADSGIDYMRAQVTDRDGNGISGWSFNEKENCIAVPYVNKDLLIRVPDLYKNVLEIELKNE